MTTQLTPSGDLKSQWQNPSDIFSLLLLVGGDVIQKAIARLTSVQYRLFGAKICLTPVAFSFGWVAYAFMMIGAAVSDCRLMPSPDCSVKVINCANGFVRDNESWVLGRILRDQEYKINEAMRTEDKPNGSNGKVSFMIDIFRAEPNDLADMRPSWMWKWCWAIIGLQWAIALVPGFVGKNWDVFTITSIGTVLALCTAALPQWGKEKWSAPIITSNKTKTITLTRGNGHQYAMVITSSKGAWDLEKMATPRIKTQPWMGPILFIMAAFWILLLITATGLKHDTRYLLVIGGIGMLQNVVIAAVPVKLAKSGVLLAPWKTKPSIVGYQANKEAKQEARAKPWDRSALDQVGSDEVRDVMGALMELAKCEGMRDSAATLLSVFFPGAIDYQPAKALSDQEETFWRTIYQSGSPNSTAPGAVEHMKPGRLILRSG